MLKAFDQYTAEERQAVLALLKQSGLNAARAAAFLLNGSASVQIEIDEHHSSCGVAQSVRVLEENPGSYRSYGALPISLLHDTECGDRFIVAVKRLPKNLANPPRENPWHIERQKCHCAMFRNGDWKINKYTGAREFFTCDGRIAWGKATPKRHRSPRAIALLGGVREYVVDVYHTSDAFEPWQERDGREHQLILRAEARSLKKAADLIFDTRYPEARRFLSEVRRNRRSKSEAA